jgi:hypothetical protein
VDLLKGHMRVQQLLLLLVLCRMIGMQQLLVPMPLALVVDMWLPLVYITGVVHHWAVQHTAEVGRPGWLMLYDVVACCCCCRCPWHFVFVTWCCSDTCCITHSSLQGHQSADATRFLPE